MALHRRTLLAYSGGILAAMAGCLGDDVRPNGGGTVAASSPEAPDARIVPDVSTEEIATLAAANTTFAFDWYETLIEHEPEDDHVVSPLSVSIALAMAWAGARGETEAAMADTLHFPFEQDDLHPACNGLVAELESRADADVEGDPPELRIANALWRDEAFEPREEYVETLGAHYGANPAALDFGNAEETVDIVNDWVDERTEGTIPEILEKKHITDDLVVILTNAIYLYAGWQYDFPEEATEPATFEGMDGETGTVELMAQTERLPYAEIDGHQVIELPYVGGELAMVVLLPAADEFTSFEAALDADRFDTFVAALEPTYGTLALPRFELEGSYTLRDQLSDLGMGIAFERGRGDLSGIGGDKPYIADVLHEGYLAVEEDGTEAAAATAVLIEDVDDSSPDEAFEMVVDRPFVAAIHDRDTGSVLFLGRMVDVPTDPAAD